MLPTEYRLKQVLPVTLTVIPTITAAGIYAAGDAVGGLMEFTNAVGDSRESGVIQAFIIIDDDKESDIMELHLFNQTFSATTDNAAFAPSDDDLENYIGYVECIVADYTDFADNSTAVTKNINLPFNLVADGTSLFGQLVTRGTPTYTAVDDLTIKLVVLQDWCTTRN